MKQTKTFRKLFFTFRGHQICESKAMRAMRVLKEFFIGAERQRFLAFQIAWVAFDNLISHKILKTSNIFLALAELAAGFVIILG